jgi:hypothetical protein
MRRQTFSASVGVLMTALLGSASSAAVALPPDTEISAEGPNATSAHSQPRVDITVVADPAWGDASPQDIQAVLASVAAVMLENFPGKRVQPIVVAHSDLQPITLFRRSSNDEHWVLLTAKDRYWAQYAYEFAHELSHILSNYEHHMGSAAAASNQWFEEVLCEIGSLYALKSMAAVWEHSPPFPNWAPYAKALERYAERLKGEAHRELPPATSLAAWFKDAESQLQNDPYMRKRNEIVANALLPLFEERPAMWGAVGYLHAQRIQSNFENYLREWHEQVPDEYKGAIQSIAALFGFPPGETAYAPASLPQNASELSVSPVAGDEESE